MDEIGTKKLAESSNVSTATTRWAGAQFIGLAQQLNEQCVDLLRQLAASTSDPEPPPFILRNRDLWRLLDVEARKRVAAFPFVIFDIRFKDIEWWQELVSRPSMASPDVALFSDLLFETLLFARQAAREDINVVKAVFAMAPPVASVIASLSLQQVRSLVASAAQGLRVRWYNDPNLWHNLLSACIGADQAQMTASRRQAKLLFCGEVIPSRTAGNKLRRPG